MELAVGQRKIPAPVRRLGFRLPGLGLAPVYSLEHQSRRLISRRNGCIHVEGGRLVGVTGRWWPYIGNQLQATIDFRLRPLASDRCQLYFHDAWGSPGFLSLSYVRSGPKTSLSSFYAATLALDAIAELKRSNAIVCHVTNARITDRLLHRWGWEEHCQHWPGRHFIKRFYGCYPAIKAIWRERLTLSSSDRPVAEASTEEFPQVTAEDLVLR